MQILDQTIVLRDMQKEDIEDYVYWFTKKKEWQAFDAPWENTETCEADERKSWTEYYDSLQNLKETTLRQRLEIEYQGKHIGWVCSYLLDDSYEWISPEEHPKIERRAIGIDICENEFWSKGIGPAALKIFMNYHLNMGYQELYTQTWSGNVAMIKAALKLGFQICSTKKNVREVDGKRYDALTFIYQKKS